MNTTLEHKSQTANQRAQQHESQSAKAYPSRTIVHAKLEMTEPGDHDEQEADAVANTIMSGAKIARKISSGSGGSAGIAVSSQMESQLNHLQGGGQVMPDGLRNMMERGFNRDFSQVRLHTDSEAASLSSSINAKAFTHGNDIYFNQGQFSPNTSEGQKLMAHELTHVVQGGGKVGRQEENAEEEKVALIFHANPHITSYQEDGSIITYTDHSKDEYSKSAEAAAKAIKEQNNPDENLFHLPNVKPSKVFMFETFTRFDFFEKIEMQKDNSISYLSVYSHGQSDQIVLGYLSQINGEWIDIDLHFKHIVEKAPLLRNKFCNNATIELWGCNLGSGALPIAQVLANTIGKGVNVYAWNSSTQKKEENGQNITDGTFIASKSNRSRLMFTEKSYEDLLKYNPLYDRRSAKKKQKLPEMSDYLKLLRLLDDMSKGKELPEDLESYQEIYERLLEYERKNLYRPK